jgi:hypothetical protein
MQLELLRVMHELFDQLFQVLNEVQRELKILIYLYQLLQMFFRFFLRIVQAKIIIE